MILLFFKKYFLNAPMASLVKKLSLLTFVSVFISVFALVLVISIMSGMNKGIEDRVTGIQGHIFIDIQNLDSEVDLQKLQKTIQNSLSGKVEHLKTVESEDVIVSSIDGQFRSAVIRGMKTVDFSQLIGNLNQLNKKENNFEALQRSQTFSPPEEDEVLIGVDLAQTLGILEGDYISILSPVGLVLPAGQTPRIHKLKIKRIISVNLSDEDSQVIWYNSEKSKIEIDSNLAKKKVIEISFAEPLEVEKYQGELSNSELGSVYKLEVKTWIDQNQALFFSLKLEKMMIGLFLGLAGLIGASGVISVLALLVAQKEKDLKILYALGLSQQKIFQIFFSFGSLISMGAVLSGAIVGSGLAVYLEKYPVQMPRSDVFYDSSLPARFNLSFVLAVVFISWVITSVGIWLPLKNLRKVSLINHQGAGASGLLR